MPPHRLRQCRHRSRGRTLQMEATARQAMTWFSAKWIALAAGGFVAMAAMAWEAVGRQRSEVTE